MLKFERREKGAKAVGGLPRKKKPLAFEKIQASKEMKVRVSILSKELEVDVASLEDVPIAVQGREGMRRRTARSGSKSAFAAAGCAGTAAATAAHPARVAGSTAARSNDEGGGRRQRRLEWKRVQWRRHVMRSVCQ